MNSVVSLFVLAVALLSAAAQAQSSSQPTVETLQAELNVLKVDANYHRNAVEKLQKQNNELRRRVEGSEVPLWEKYIQTKQREYDFQAQMMTVNESNFQHQRIASYVILAMVVLVVIVGLWFAHIQLMAGLKPVAARQGTGTTAADGEPQRTAVVAASQVPLGVTTIDASLQKVTITSSVVGIIVLVISLAFLYIYAREIFHIEIVDPYRPKILNPSEQPTTPATTAPISPPSK